MIEAVNSVVSNATLLRPAVEQQSVAASYAANPQRVQKAALAPYLSLYVKVDVNYNEALLLMRDGDTGDVVRQIPSESQLEAYRRAQSAVPQKQNTQEETVDPVSAGAGQSNTESAPAPQSQNVQGATPPSSNVTANTAPTSVDTEA